MPINEVPRWKQKLIGREHRWTKLYELFYNSYMGVGEAAISSAGEVIPEIVENATSDSNFFAAPVKVMGKNFYPGIKTGFIRDKMKVYAAAGAKKATAAAFNKGAEVIQNAELVDTKFNMTAYDVEHDVVTSGVYLNEEKIAELKSQTGYDFNSQYFMEKVKRAIRSAGDRFNDFEWREMIMPYILKTAFKEEIEQMYMFISANANENGVLSTELLDNTLTKATGMMKDIISEYTTKLANDADVLAVPMRLSSHEPDPMSSALKPEGMTPKEEKRYDRAKKSFDKNGSSFILHESELRLYRERALAFFKNKKPAEIEHDFNEKMNSGLTAGKGLDDKEVVKAVLEVRELRKRYNKRGFFNKYLFHPFDAKKERDALNRMRGVLNERYSKDAVDRVLRDQEYVSNESYNAKNLYNLADASPRDMWSQHVGDVVGSYTFKVIRKIVDDAVAPVTNIAITGAKIAGGMIKRVTNKVYNYFKGGADNASENEEPQQNNIIEENSALMPEDEPQNDNSQSKKVNINKNEKEVINVNGEEFVEADSFEEENNNPDAHKEGTKVISIDDLKKRENKGSEKADHHDNKLKKEKGQIKKDGKEKLI
ncbi:MAG: hypothetical protein E7301_13490 [Butyrivibrio sp.]|nr:hypothetical protein [Butyrivibrio sp.]